MGESEGRCAQTLRVREDTSREDTVSSECVCGRE